MLKQYAVKLVKFSVHLAKTNPIMISQTMPFKVINNSIETN